MWTPKRILLLAVGVVLFLGCYVAYAQQLGMVDGLPPLPRQYWQSTDDPPHLERRKIPLVAKTLELAFGKDCPELKQRDYPIKIEVPGRGIVLATKDVTFLDDGRVKLIPLSVGVFGKTRAEDGTPEINTIRGDVAYLTFEHPIRSMADMGKHKIMAGEIAGNIRIVNNHRTLARDDDLTVDISKGPIYYDQKQQRIWTDDFVHVLDAQSKPRPTEISGQGLVLDLITEPPPRHGPGRPARPRQMDNITGVKQVLLKSAVDMHLYVDAGSGFLGGPKDGPAQPKLPKKDGAGKPTVEKAHVIIKTQGPFRHDMLKDHAWFDIPARDPRRIPGNPEIVSVVRVHDALGKYDQLECDHLELQFRKKQPPPGAKPAAPSAKAKKEAAPAPSTNLEIETAHATGESVTLVSDAEMLNAHGYDFFYDARTLTTTLKGKPMRALKEGNEIHARQMQIRNTKEGQSATALGPGRLSLLDKATGKRHMHAHWQDVLESGRDGQFDLLHLTGNAAFLDDANGQELRGDDLRVWLLPEQKKNGPAAAPKPPQSATADGKPKQGQHSRRPHHLIATGHVRTTSKEFNIKDAQRFVVWFHDAPPTPPTSAAARLPQPGAPGQAPAADGKKPPPAGAAKPPAEEKKPIDLWARSVEAHIQRAGEKNELQKVRAEGPAGTVHVVQSPAKKDEKGVDIKGDTLQLTAFPDGNYLVVTGDLARLELEKMLILGPEVNIDQVANKAWVNGIGAMTIDSDTDFQGKKLKKPTPLTIHWNKAMVFTGPLAVFHGGIEADQDNARLKCQEMQVFFDKPISLKQGQKDKEKARVRNLVCDRGAHVEDTTIENNKLLKYLLLTGNDITFDNVWGTVQASGPGEARTFQAGGAGPGVGPPPPKPQPAKPGAPKNNMKLTFVSYYARMNGYQKNHMAIFYTNVRVLHLASSNPHMQIDLDHLAGNLPEGAMYLRCDRLKVFSRPPVGGKATQVMDAQGRVSVSSQEFHGEAERVIYDEEKDQVIFDGGQNGTATLSKQKINGAPPQTIEGRKIIYDRRTGSHTGTEVKTLSGQNGQ